MRIFSLAAAMFLTACGSAPQAGEPKGERIACALDGAKDFAEVCRLERDGPRFSVHRPDGGFRRFEPVEGRSIHLIDGADAALVLPRANDYQSGALWRYARNVGPASKGALTHPGAKAETHVYADI